MPDVLPTINSEPPQGIQAVLDLIYLWNPDVANGLIEQLNAALAQMTGVVRYKGSVATAQDLPNDPQVGDLYNVIDSGQNFVWSGTEWDDLSSTADLSKYRTAAQQDVIDDALSARVSAVESQVSGKQDAIADLDVIRKGSAMFVFEQGAAATTWTITHNLDKYPSVTIVDSAGTIVDCTVIYLNSNTCEVRFSAAFKGTAYLN